ncbi:hypothetical protein FQZ97_499440 [compost metagenome]
MGGRRPPAVPHQRGLRADGLAGADAVADVVRRRRAPGRLRRLRVVLRAHRLVAFETAGGDHHPVARLDAQRPTVAADTGAGDPAVDDDQLVQRAVQPQRHVAIQQRAAQRGDQRVAEGQEAVAARQPAALDVAPVAPHHLERQGEPARPAAEQHLRLLHGHRHAPHHQRAGRRRAHAQEFLAQLGGVERLRVHGAEAGLAAGHLGVVVGVVRLRLEAHPRPRGEVFDHRPAVLDIGLDAPVVDLAVGHRADVGDRLGGRVAAAKRGDAVVVGNPDAAAGHRRGAAVLAALLDQQHVQAEVVGAQRGGHPPGAGAHHQHVATVIPGAVGRTHRGLLLVVVRGE